MAGGRPSTFNQDTADAICERIAEGESLRAICLDEDLPCKATIFKWLSQREDFADQYARARETQADTLFDEILSIADESKNDTYTDKDGNERTDQEVIARSRLRVDARKWMAGKLRPKVYGDKLDMTHANPDGSKMDMHWTVEFVAPKNETPDS